MEGNCNINIKANVLADFSALSKMKYSQTEFMLTPYNLQPGDSGIYKIKIMNIDSGPQAYQRIGNQVSFRYFDLSGISKTKAPTTNQTRTNVFLRIILVQNMKPEIGYPLMIEMFTDPTAISFQPLISAANRFTILLDEIVQCDYRSVANHNSYFRFSKWFPKPLVITYGNAYVDSCKENELMLIVLSNETEYNYSPDVDIVITCAWEDC